MLRNYLKTARRNLFKNKVYSLINIVGLSTAIVCVLLALLFWTDEHNFDTFHENNPNLYRIITIVSENKGDEPKTIGGTGQVQGAAFKAAVPEIDDYVRVMGGGIYNTNSSAPDIINSVLAGNNAGLAGGGMYNTTSPQDIKNSTFFNNSAGFEGGGMINVSSSPSILNAIFWDNNQGGDIAIEGADILSIGSGNPTVTHSLTQENSTYSTGTGIINNQDPHFVDAAKGFLQLKCNSSAINAGGAAEAPLIDITGFARVGLPDIGAFEYGQAVLDYVIPDGLNPTISGTPEVKASNQILNTNNVLYQGSNNVQLLPGFSVAPVSGAATVFRAEIGGGCD